MSSNLTLADLAEASGLPARTIRYYIARGLLDGPVKAGRDAAYTAEHLARLEEIKSLQADGQTLSEIARRLGGGPERAAPQPAPWWQHALSEDVIVWTRADMSPWRMKQVSTAISGLARCLEQPGGADQKEQRRKK